MSASNKEIKISLGLNQDEFDKVKRSIGEIAAEFRKLGDVMKSSGFGGGGGGFGGGGGGFGTATAGMGTSGRSIAQHRATAGGAGAGGITDGLTRAVQNSASLFKGAASGSKDAFKIMSDGLKDHVRTADGEIRRLQQSLQGLERTYDKLKSRQGSASGGKLTDSAISQAQGAYFQTADQLDRARTQRAKMVKAQDDMEEAANPSFFNRARGYFSQKKEKQGFFGAAMQGAGLGGVGTALSSPLAAVTGGVMLGSKLMDLGKTNQISNVQYGIDSQMFRSNSRAEIGSIFGGNAQAIRHGDMARVAAMIQLRSDPAFQNVMGPGYAKMLKERRLLEAVPGGLGGLAQFGAAKVGGFFSGMMGMGASSGVGSTDAMTNKFVTRTAQEQALQAQTMQSMIENKIKEDPGFSDRMNTFYGESTSNAGLLRGMGMGGGNVRIGGKNGRMVEQSEWVKARADAQLRDVGEFAAARQELAGTAGRGFLGRGESILGAKTGGLSNVASLIGVGAQFNGGDYSGGSAFLGRSGKKGYGIQSMIGRGGVDVTAATQLTGLGAGMMTSGSFQGHGSGLMETLLSAGFTGTTGGDMRAAREVGMGVNDLSKVMSGATDPLQVALNASAALKAGANAPYSAKWALQRLDPSQSAEFQKTGQVPPDLKALGVTKDMMTTYLSTQTSTMFSRVSSGMMGGASGDALGRYKAAGGFSYMKGWSKTRVEQEARDLAPALHMAGGASSTGGALGSIRFQLAAAGILGKPKGAGAHDTIRRNTAMAAAGAAKGVERAKTAADYADESGMQTATYGAAASAEKDTEAMRKAGLKAMQPGADVQGAIEGISSALTNFVSALKRETSMFKGKAGAPK
jgi:hypothetical protein